MRGGIGVGSRRYAKVSVGGGYEGAGGISVDYSFGYPLSGVSETYGTHRMTVGWKFGGEAVGSKVEIKDDIYEKVAELVREGRYSEGIRLGKKMVEEGGVEGEETRGMMWRLEKVARYVGEVRAGEGVGGMYERMVKEGVGKYVLENEAKGAVESMAYGYSLKGGKGTNGEEKVKKLYKEIAIENGIVMEEMSGSMNYVEQKLLKALGKFKEKKYDEVVRLCEESLYLEPNNVVAYKRLGSVFYVLGDKERARSSWEKVIELAPNDKESEEIKDLLRELK